MERRGAHQIAADVASGSISAAAVIDEALSSARGIGRSLNAVLETFDDHAMERARALDAARERGETPGPLAGVPVLVKDNICTSVGRTTCASRMLEHYTSPFDATAVARLEAAGAIVIGKSNLDEFAMGGSGEHSAFGPTKNPWDLSRVPGGSSSGSAAAVAAGIVPMALGSDTGGSVRQPAAFCGVVGLKPTYGLVSRLGLVAFASSLDQIGPITRTVRDAALALRVIAGHDPGDATSSRRHHPDPLEGLDHRVHHLTVGVPRQARGEANRPEAASAFDDALRTFAGLGARIVDLDLPSLDAAIAAYYIVSSAEASSNLARFDGLRYGRRAASRPGESVESLVSRSRTEGLGPEVQRRIMLGTHVLSAGYADAYYANALRVRRLLKNEFDAAFASGCHVIATPTTPGAAFRIGAHDRDPLAMYLEDLYTVPANLAGLPAISLPCGVSTAQGSALPLGLQLIAPAFHDAELLRAARMFESASPHDVLRPPVVPAA
ncbi:MAG: Asp-tRNA(Asn)/Glu-tRNA(Gln) amidotransferase subunit GatA [Phycisphaeraceae bacterium]|nr:MAG: Asp-tRNA(Asn)/Glu-tRNA(Gln) amidotransferase subunit GatA [Phycisphaeraceae bacterium]